MRYTMGNTIRVTEIMEILPPYRGEERLVRVRQFTGDIVKLILQVHKKRAKEYDTIADKFWRGNVKSTAQGLFDFMRSNVGYVVETERSQGIKAPAAILAEGRTHGGDCKHYASFIVGVCEALRRQGKPIRAYYRFAGYEYGSKKLGHVFAIVVDPVNNIEYWVDPVLKNFDQRTPSPVYYENKIPASMENKIGELYEISGIPQMRSLVSGVTSKQIPGGTEYVMSDDTPANTGKHWLDNSPKAISKTPPANPNHAGKVQVNGVWEDIVQFFEGKGNSGGQKVTHVLAVHKDHPAVKQLAAQGIHAMPVPSAQPAAPDAKKKGLFANLSNDISQGQNLISQGQSLFNSGGGDDVSGMIGKAHQKFQPGRLLKKFGGAAPRNAFLALVKINFLSLGTKMNKAFANPASKKKMEDFWKKAGGNPNKLSTAIHEGVGTYNKLHHKHTTMNGPDADNLDMMAYTLPGQDEMYTVSDYKKMGFIPEQMVENESVGFAPAAIPALLAAATPVIVAAEHILKSFGVDTGKLKAHAAAANADVAANHNAAVDDGTDVDGTVDHGAGVTTKKGSDGGDQSMEIDAADNTGEGDGSESDEDGSGDDKALAKTGGGNFMTDAWEWVKDHKGPIIGITVGLTTIVIIYKIATHKHKGRR